MLVGILFGDSLREYHELSAGAPVQLIIPPVLYLSRPDELLSRDTASQLSSLADTSGVSCIVQPTMFRNLFNPANSNREMCAACLPLGEMDSRDTRRRLGVQSFGDFVPYFKIVNDAMQSLSCRRFFRSFTDALSRRRLMFTVFDADQSNEQHQMLFEQYNSEVQNEMSSYAALRPTA